MRIYRVSFTVILLSCLCILHFNYAVNAQEQNDSEWFSQYVDHKKLNLSKSFDFNQLILIDFFNGLKSSAAKISYSIRYPQNSKYMAMHIAGLNDPAPEVVVDFEENVRIVFMEFDDVKIAKIKPAFDARKNVALVNLSSQKYSPTGKSKNILGFQTAEYTLDGDFFAGVVWVSQNMNDKFKQPFSDLGLCMENPLNGYVLEAKGINKTTGEPVKFQVKEMVHDVPYYIDCKEYSSIQRVNE